MTPESLKKEGNCIVILRSNLNTKGCQYLISNFHLTDKKYFLNFLIRCTLKYFVFLNIEWHHYFIFLNFGKYYLVSILVLDSSLIERNTERLRHFVRKSAFNFFLIFDYFDRPPHKKSLDKVTSQCFSFTSSNFITFLSKKSAENNCTYKKKLTFFCLSSIAFPSG